MSKITPPAEGTKANEISRSTFDAVVSAVPVVGGPLVTLIRLAFPSQRDLKRAAWEETVSTTLSDTSLKAEQVVTQIGRLSIDHTALNERVINTEALAEQTAFDVGELKKATAQGVIADEPLEGELKIFRDLVERGQYHTVLEMVRARHDPEQRKPALPDATLASIRSLEGLCLHKLGEYPAAAARFLEAARLDPSIKHRSNVVVAYLMEGNFGEARRALDEVLKEQPDQAHHWANHIYVESARGRRVPEEEIPASLRNEQDVRLARVNALRVAEDPAWRNLARLNMSMFPGSDEARRAGAEAILDSVILAERSSPPEGVLMSSLRQDAGVAALVLKELWSAHETSELFRHHPDITLLQNAALGLRIAEKPHEAAALIARHFPLFQKDPGALLTAGMIALDAGAAELLDRILVERFEGVELLCIEKAMRQGELQAALDLVERREDDPDYDERIPLDRFADMLRAATSEKSERAAAFGAVLDRYPPDGYADLILCDLSTRTEVPEIADVALDRALGVDLSDKVELRFRLSLAAMRRGRPGIVIDLLDGHVDPTIASPERVRLAYAHAMVSPPRTSGLTFFAALREGAADDASLQMAGGIYHLNRGVPKEAVPWLRRSLNASPGEAQAIIHLWIALRRQGADARAQKFLEDIKLDELKGSPLDRLQVAQLLWHIGRTEALDFAYQIAVRALDSPEICLAYSHLILSDAFHPNTPAFAVPQIVEPGAWVRLSRKAGVPFEFVLVDHEDDVPLHITAAHGIAAGAMGLKAGDTFETTDGPVRSTWTVEELKPKTLHLFHAISGSFQDRFPGYGGLWAVTTAEDDITPLLEGIRRRRAYIESLETSYLEHPLPLGAVARAGGGTSIDFAMHLAQTGIGVVSATGQADEMASERQEATRAAGESIVLDSYTLWLLAKLSMLDAVRAVYPRVLVPQSMLDEFSILVEQRRQMPEGRKTVAAEGDRFILRESSAEEVANEVTDLIALRDYVQSRAEVVGTEAPEVFSSEVLQLADLLGNQFDCLSVAAREGAVLVTADLRLRQVAAAICTLRTFGIDALIEETASRAALTDAQRVEAVLTLCELGHSYVGLNAHMLFSILRRDDTEALTQFARAARYLGTPGADPVSHTMVAAGFARIVSVEVGHDVRTQAAISIVLRNLTRMPSKSLAEVINAFARLADTATITRYVGGWLRGHFLYGTYVAQIEADP